MNDEVTGRGSDAPATSQRAWGERYDRTLMNTFGHPRRVLVRGRGADVWDADGRHYTDLLAGLAVHALGHAHPAVLEAISGQAATLGHISNLFASPPQIELGERLIGLATLDAPGTPARVFFANSGTEANEAAFKLSRRTGRGRIVAMEGSFHGRTMGALAITHNEHYREPFEPLPGEIVWVPYGDDPALERAVDETVAAGTLRPPDVELVRHLILTHHGLYRGPGPICPQDDGAGEPYLDPACPRWAAQIESFHRLNERYGPYGLALTEAVLRLADWEVSRKEQEDHERDE